MYGNAIVDGNMSSPQMMLDQAGLLSQEEITQCARNVLADEAESQARLLKEQEEIFVATQRGGGPEAR